MECPECKYVMVEDPETDLATCPSCDHVVEMTGGPDLPKPTGSMKMMPIGKIMRSAWKVYRQNLHLFLGIWAIPALLGFVLNFFILYSSYDAIVASGGVLPQGAYTGIFLVGTLLPIFMNIFFAAAVIRMSSDVILHGETSLSSGLGVLGNKLPLLLAGSIAFALPLAVGDIFCSGITSMVCCYWWMFALVILVLENAHLSEAFSVSKEFATSRYSFSFTMVLMLTIVFLVHGVLGVFSPLPTLGLLLIAPDFVSSLNGMIFNTIMISIIEWFLFPLLIIAIVTFYLAGRKAIQEQIAEGDKEEEAEEGDEAEDGDADKTPYEPDELGDEEELNANLPDEDEAED